MGLGLTGLGTLGALKEREVRLMRTDGRGQLMYHINDSLNSKFSGDPVDYLQVHVT